MAQVVENYEGEVQYNGFSTNKAQNITASSGAFNFDYSASSGTFKTPTGTTTLNGNIVVAAGKSISGGIQNVISGSGATVTLTAAQSGSLVLFDRAAGIIFTLPAPTVGLWFEFAVATTITSNNAKVITDAGTTLLAGLLDTGVDNTANKQWVGNGTTHIAITQNGTTTGGIIGSILMLNCVSSTLWAVTGSLVASGTPATPFATS